MQLAYTTADVPAAVAKAVAKAVAYVADRDGCLVELCTPVGG